MLPDFGIDVVQWNELIHQLPSIRDEIMSIRAPNADFIRRPEELLAAYVADRRQSELGRLFRRASYLHTIVDRVVVLGVGSSYLGAKAILESSCQPYWNELSRADRGSKPRMYFAGNNIDNDATQGLLHLLDAHKGMPAENELDRWGLAVINKNGQAPEVAIAFHQFLTALESSADNDPTKLAELLVIVTGNDGKFRNLVQERVVSDFFSFPDGADEPFLVLSSVGLVPAALVGVNVIELLQGAVAMTEHFATAVPEENVVLQFVATNHLLEKKRGLNTRVMSLWSTALNGFGHWHDHLASNTLGKDDIGFTPMSIVNSRDLHARLECLIHGRRDKIVNNIIVEEVRFDPLSVGTPKEFLPEVMKIAIHDTNQALREHGRPSTNLFVPRVDELHMGQLFQMMMLSTALESRLRGPGMR